jgi:hypothetical protein
MTTRRVEEVDADGGRRVTEYSDAPATTEHQEAVIETGEERVTHSNPWNVARGFLQMIGVVALAALAIVETLLGFRLAFLAAEANQSNSFVEFIYDATGWLVEPFEGIIANDTLDGGGIFEWSTVIAMVVYAVAVFLFVLLLWALSSFPSPSGTRSSAVRTSHTDHTAHES